MCRPPLRPTTPLDSAIARTIGVNARLASTAKTNAARKLFIAASALRQGSAPATPFVAGPAPRIRDWRRSLGLAPPFVQLARAFSTVTEMRRAHAMTAADFL